MHATIYGRGQMVIPAQARKEARINTGDIVSVETKGDGRLVLVRLEKPRVGKARGRLVRRKGSHPVIVGANKLSLKQISDAVADFP
jgi:AbrB family looped-hinge helix DNA binding protein